ncbi:uncharacterized protein F4812DRAFT_437378 [Daldinia caldariorum]|uniref:uncharacterized protein n=1 Tax=Daldinia caldariorum TaxID=326644 RepID=UPI002007E6A3|nr:uncharacterized protein F4812DRAFT_437378 [Daldinia caldariorum]KAI1465747.1 hypothetical protein F4812DRAFT_437378 [Daldinia caldariorum]
MHFFEERSPVGSPGLPALLFDIFVWNAFFPFPPIHDSSGELCIDEMAFTRAVSVLAHSHLQYLSLDNYPRVEHDGMDGSWGPYSGQFVLIRLRDTSDYIRWLFRSLAIPNDTILGYETTILVPRFFMTQQRPNMPSPEEDFEEDFGRRTAEQQVVIVEKESERTVDIQDVLSEYAPGNVPWAPEHFRGVDPLREGYKLALPLLPHHPYDLTDLHVPTAKVRTLLQMLGKNGTELMTATERLGNEGLSWEEFQDVFIRHAETIASNLSFTFNNLTRLYTW